MSLRLAALMLMLVLALAGCASDPATSAPAAAPVANNALPLQGRTAQALTVADAVPEVQLPAVLAGFDAALKARLTALPPSPACRLVASKAGSGQPARLVLDADRAFEVGNAQLKPELLLPLADVVAASRAGGAWVIHVLGIAGSADEADLAERRAASVLAVLASHGVAGGRLRSETRSGSSHSLELRFAPIVEGREARAWMSPDATPTARR